MRPVQYRPLLLMIHGVNSTLEWSGTVLRVLEPHFRCVLIRYRYFHTLWGPIKVYIWPAALLLLLAYGILVAPHLAASVQGQPDVSWNWTANLLRAQGGNAVTLWVLLGLLAAEAFVVINAEIRWTWNVERQQTQWFPPFLFAGTGLAGAVICNHPWQWALPVAALVGIALFLDLREYSPRPLSWSTLVGLPALGMVLVAWLVYDLFARRSLTPSCWIVLVVGIVGVLEPFWRGNLAFEKVSEALARAQTQHPFPFVIAHSLGTHLIGHVLHETYNLRLGRVLFTGCVLDRGYPWHRVVPPQREGVLAVTNYVGRLDLVPLATGCLRRVWLSLTWPLHRFSPGLIVFLGRWTSWRPLGSAGFAGFADRPALVHTQTPAQDCGTCAAGGQRAWVHNIDHGWARHSTLNGSTSFQSWSWLPCLWGMSPHEFDEWVAVCRLGHAFGQPELDPGGQPLQPYRPQRPDGFSLQETRLITRLWCWPSEPEIPAPAVGQRLEHYVAEILGTIPGASVSAAQLMKRLPKFVFDTVNEAWEESQKEQDQDLHKLERLHPQAALRHAVLLALAEEGQPAALAPAGPPAAPRPAGTP